MIPSFAIDRYTLRLRLTRAARFHFLHGGVVRGLLSAALRSHELPDGIIPCACESGQVRFETGDLYHIGLTLIGKARPLMEPIVEGIREVGRTHRSSQEDLPTLSGNFEVDGVEALGSVSPAEDLARLCGCASLTLRFVSPLRLKRPRDLQLKGRRYFDRDCFPVDYFLTHLRMRAESVAGRCFEAMPEELGPCPPVPDSASAQPVDLLWVDLPIKGAGEEPSQPKGYTLGGVLGAVELKGFPEEWLPWLLCGSYWHAGEKEKFGFGRYRIVCPGGELSDPFRAARTVLERAASPQALAQALSTVREKSDAAGVDGIAPDRFAAESEVRLAELSRALASRAYRPAPLLGFLEPKKSGGVRPIAIPTVRDRVAQRAACNIMSPAVDALLEDCAYAYRKGFSRAGAARAIEAAYEEGFRFVLDADITSFFDAVDWARLEGKLRALYPADPIVDLVMSWVRAPVVFDGKELARERGLPQGAAVSPFLANLFLDEIDEELLGKDYRLVRYADDFVVLCRDLESARRAQEDARAALERLGLSLSPAKTSIRSFDQRFNYLGYLFCRSVVLESAREGADRPQEPLVEDVPALSWLAAVPFERVHDLTSRRARRQRPPTVVSLGDRGQSQISKTGLYVTQAQAEVEVRGETVRVRGRDERVDEIPLHTLSHVVFCGKVRPTVPLLLRLSENGIPSFFCHRDGELYAAFAPHAPDWALWLKQGEFVSNEQARVALGRAVIAAKLHNFAALAVRFKLSGGAEAAAEIRKLEQQCENQESRDSLRGLEGKAAAIYFAAMKESLSPDWRFEGRRCNPPPDPINAMLSFGYTSLYNHISTALYGEGLHPRIGILHEERGAYHALACDIQEEFRHLVDALVWAMVHRGEVKTTHFVASDDGKYPCLMTWEFRKKFIGAFEDRLLEIFTPNGGSPVRYREFIDIQAHRVRELVGGRLNRYTPLRVHA